MTEKKKASEYLFVMVLLAALMFFGTAAWIVCDHSPGEQTRWMLDVFSAFLFISVFFWLLVLEDLRGGNGEEEFPEKRDLLQKPGREYRTG